MRFIPAIQIRPVLTSSDKETAPALVQLPSPEDAAEYAAIAGYWAKQSTKVVAALYVGKKVVDTAQQIAVVAASAHLNK